MGTATLRGRFDSMRRQEGGEALEGHRDITALLLGAVLIYTALVVMGLMKLGCLL